MQWSGYGERTPPPHPGDHVTPFLVDLNRAVAKLSHSMGEIKGTIHGIEGRIELMDSQVGEVRAMLSRLKDRVRRMEARTETPSALDRVEKLAPMLKEAWPFMAFAAAAIAKAFGYDLGYLSGITGP